MQEIINIIKNLLPKAHVRVKDSQTIVVYPGFVAPSYVKVWAEELGHALLITEVKEVRIGQGGVVDGCIVVKL